ncbi:MAG: hypothetical protein KDD56_03230 [Bdellovibrionales bacterium]|nr:hypothetical protein [Bdellovibrionales bacterium]
MNSNLGSQESWERALSISGKIGTIPGLFSSTIRTLQLDQSKGGTLSPGGRHGIKTLFKGPSMKSAVYHAALTYRPEKLEQDTFQRASNLIKVFNPEELATIIAILFAYKKISRICQKYDLVWQERYKEMCRDIDLGALIGEALPKIGLSWGMLIPCINHMSLALMLDADQKALREYKLHLKNQNIFSDPEKEFELFGCTHGQVCSSLVQKLCVGTEISEAMLQGFQVGYREKQLSNLNELKVQVCKIWIDEFVSTCNIPDMPHRGEFYPKTDALNKLLPLAKEIAKNGSTHYWLSKTAENINPESHPMLFLKGELTKSGEGIDIMATDDISEEKIEELEQEVDSSEEDSAE